MTCAEGCQAANETSGLWTCAYKKGAGEVVLEMEEPKCSSVAGSLDDPSTGVSHDGYDIPSQNGWAVFRPSSYESSGNMLATSARCLSSGELVSKAQIAGSSGSQMPCSDTLTPSGVSVNPSCGGPSLGDTYMVFCAEGCQAVSNDTSTLTCACDRCANPLLFFLRH